VKDKGEPLCDVFVGGIRQRDVNPPHAGNTSDRTEKTGKFVARGGGRDRVEKRNQAKTITWKKEWGPHGKEKNASLGYGHIVNHPRSGGHKLKKGLGKQEGWFLRKRAKKKQTKKPERIRDVHKPQRGGSSNK